MTISAPVRFRPVPPAFREIQNTDVSSRLNCSTIVHAALFRASLQDKVADAFFLQTRGQDLDHRSELGEQQDFVAGFHGTLNQLDAEIEFAEPPS